MNKAKWIVLFLLAVAVAAPSYAVELTLGGFPSYFRIRPQVYHNATFNGVLTDAESQALGFSDHTDNIVFVDTRLRLTPQLVLSDSVTIRAQVDVADNTIWGGLTSSFANDRSTIINSSITRSDRFRGALLTDFGSAGTFGSVGSFSNPPASATDTVQFFNVRMLHADIVLPNNLGFIRAGRQPFDWGIGILANGGWDPLSDLGFVLDRFLYLKSFPIYKGSFTFVFVSDRITQGRSLTTASGDGWDGGAVALVYNQGPLTVGGYVFPYIHQTGVLSCAPGTGQPGTIPNIDQNTNQFCLGSPTSVNLKRFTLYSGLLDFKTDFFRFVAEMQGGQGKIQGLNPTGTTKIGATNILAAGRIEVYPGFPVKLIAGEFGFAGGQNVNKFPDKIDGNVIVFSPAYNLDNLLFKHMIPNIYRIEGSVINAFYGRAWGTAKVMDHVSFTPQVLFAWTDRKSAPLFVGERVRRFLGTELEGTLSVEVVPGVNFDFLGSIVISGHGLKDLINQQAKHTCTADTACNALATSQGGVITSGGPKAPWAFQGRLLVYIDQFFKK
jgi:hypothetical protein